MTKITREHLMSAAIARIEFSESMLAGELEPLVERSLSMELGMARIALASLEAEPVAWIVHTRTGDQLTNDGGYVANAEGILGLHSTPLYTAPPAPVVPEERPSLNNGIVGFDEGWNACRAAMLQAKPVTAANKLGSSPVIPDTWTGNDKANAALMMLDRIETIDPVDDDRIDGIKRIVHELAAAPQEVKP